MISLMQLHITNDLAVIEVLKRPVVPVIIGTCADCVGVHLSLRYGFDIHRHHESYAFSAGWSSQRTRIGTIAFAGVNDALWVNLESFLVPTYSFQNLTEKSALAIFHMSPSEDFVGIFVSTGVFEHGGNHEKCPTRSDVHEVNLKWILSAIQSVLARRMEVDIE